MEHFQLVDQLENHLDFDMPATINSKTKTKRGPRKWREIETMKDKRRLLKELHALDLDADYTIDDIKF